MRLLHLLQLEWKKVKYNNTIKVLFLFYIALMPSLFLIGKSIPLPSELGNTVTFYMFPNVWAYLGYVGNWLNWFFLGFLAILLISNEFSYKTLRQSIINGLSRSDFFMSKFATIIFIGIVATLYYVVLAMGFGYMHTETIYWSKVMEKAYLIPQFFLNVVGYMSFALFLAICLRRTGASIVTYVGYTMFLEPILRWWLHVKVAKNITMHYYPMNAVEDLLPMPVPKPDLIKGGDMADMQMFLSSQEAILVSLLFSALFIGLSYWMIKKSDL